jgi:hypothetical protein
MALALAARLLDIEARGEPRLHPPAGDLQVVVLVLERVAGDRQLQRRGARLDRGQRDLTGDHPLQVGERIAGGGQIGARGGDVARNLAEQVGFPAGVQTGVEAKLLLREIPDILVGAGAGAELREEPGARGGELGAGLV